MYGTSTVAPTFDDWRATGRGCHAPGSVQSMDIGGLREKITPRWPVPGSNHLEQQPGNGTRLDEIRIH